MYYLLTTGRIVTERDLHTAYEICNGSVPGTHPGHYEKWIHEIYGIVRSMPKEEVSVEDLIDGKCEIEAIKMYRENHKCTLREAKDAIDKIKEEK